MEIAPFRAQLADAYHEYVSTVSSPGMAVSHETAAVLAWFCHDRNPSRVCDLGSGFSSYVLRRVCADVTSVDTDPAWLEATRQFLDRWAMDTTRIVGWDDWLGGTDLYDLMFHDLAQGDLREQAMWLAVERLAPGGLIVFDDAHHHTHRETMEAVIATHHLTFLDLRDVTLDGIGRYAIAATKESADGV